MQQLSWLAQLAGASFLVIFRDLDNHHNYELGGRKANPLSDITVFLVFICSANIWLFLCLVLLLLDEELKSPGPVSHTQPPSWCPSIPRH